MTCHGVELMFTQVEGIGQVVFDQGVAVDLVVGFQSTVALRKYIGQRLDIAGGR